MSVWDGNTPDSLLNICTKLCVQNLQTFCNFDPNFNGYYLRDGIILPSVICERMLSVCPEVNRMVDDDFLRIFKDPRTAKLRRVNLNSSSITDEGLSIVLRHNLLELDISDCEKITEESLKLINDHSADLLSLNIGNSVHIFPDEITMDEIFMSNPRLILKTPNLRKLTIKELTKPSDKYFPMLLKPLIQLQSLDLSGCYNVGSADYLVGMKQLTSLTLYNVAVTQPAILCICQIKTLRHLDISQHTEKDGIYRHPNQLLSQIIDSLPLLASLDISGTNLAGTGVAEHDQSEEMAVPDIPGLRNRVNNPLDFLGLFGTSHDACHRHHIPAKRITGDANELQILTAAHAYEDRALILRNVFRNLYYVVCRGTCLNPQLAVDVIVAGMKKNVCDQGVQAVGIACLFQIVETDELICFNVKTKEKVITAVLDAMYTHSGNSNVTQWCCQALCQFKIPQDVSFNCKRFVEVLLRHISVEEQEVYMQIGLQMLNCLIDKVDDYNIRLAGDLGAVSTLLKLIENRSRPTVCDYVVENAVLGLRSLIEGIPENCSRFLDEHGVSVFLNCIKTITDDVAFQQTMMGVLCNVAEIQQFRQQLMTEEFIKIFRDLLDSTSHNDIAVSYTAAATLSYVISDGKENWTISSPKRDDVLRSLVDAVTRWDVKTDLQMTYSTVEPVLRLLRVDHTPEVQCWALWALDNLTQVNPEVHCRLIEEEKGIEMLMDLIQRGSVSEDIRQRAKFVVNNCQSFNKSGKEEFSAAFEE